MYLKTLLLAAIRDETDEKKNPCNKKRGKGEKDWRSADGTNTHKKHLGSSNQANQDIKCLVHFLCVCVVISFFVWTLPVVVIIVP